MNLLPLTRGNLQLSSHVSGKDHIPESPWHDFSSENNPLMTGGNIRLDLMN